MTGWVCGDRAGGGLRVRKSPSVLVTPLCLPQDEVSFSWMRLAMFFPELYIVLSANTATASIGSKGQHTYLFGSANQLIWGFKVRLCVGLRVMTGNNVPGTEHYRRVAATDQFSAIVLKNSFSAISDRILGVIKPLTEQYRSLIARSMRSVF